MANSTGRGQCDAGSCELTNIDELVEALASIMVGDLEVVCDPAGERIFVKVRVDDNGVCTYTNPVDGTEMVPGVDFFPCGPVTPVCDPYIGSFAGDAIPNPVPPFNSISVSKPRCCTVQITTSAGVFTLGPKIETFTPEKFDCNLTSLEAAIVDGNCGLDEVDIFIQRTGS